LSIYFKLADACEVEPPRGFFDLVVDSFCLQCIVTDSERAKLFAVARRVLKSKGYYVIATAGYAPDRDYGDCHFDPATGIVLEGDLPCRRHITAAALVRELAGAGFTTEWHDTAADGDITFIARLT
jgi:SAM-dependent methyltransferase